MQASMFRRQSCSRTNSRIATVELQIRSLMNGKSSGAVKKILINRRSQPTPIPEEEEGGEGGEVDSAACDAAAASDAAAAFDDVTVLKDERVGIGATFHKGRNGVFEVQQPRYLHIFCSN